jgi:hypothetical protein
MSKKMCAARFVRSGVARTRAITTGGDRERAALREFPVKIVQRGSEAESWR